MHWLPVNVAASVLLQLAQPQPRDNLLYHLVAPHPVKWDVIFGAFAKQLSLPLIPYSEWLALLEDKALTSEPHINAFNLLDFYRVGIDIESRVTLSTAHAELASSVLKQSSPPGAADASRYLAFWE